MKDFCRTAVDTKGADLSEPRLMSPPEPISQNQMSWKWWVGFREGEGRWNGGLLCLWDTWGSGWDFQIHFEVLLKWKLTVKLWTALGAQQRMDGKTWVSGNVVNISVNQSYLFLLTIVHSECAASLCIWVCDLVKLNLWGLAFWFGRTFCLGLIVKNDNLRFKGALCNS